MSDDRTDDIKALYQRAFREFGSVALWNMRPIKDPTPADALAITAALRTHGRMDGGGSRSASRSFAMPISKFQSDVLQYFS